MGSLIVIVCYISTCIRTSLRTRSKLNSTVKMKIKKLCYQSFFFQLCMHRLIQVLYNLPHCLWGCSCKTSKYLYCQTYKSSKDKLVATAIFQSHYRIYWPSPLFLCLIKLPLDTCSFELVICCFFITNVLGWIKSKTISFKQMVL